jgi:hypothetical protein
MHVNGLLKSSSKPHMSVTFLFLLRAQYDFNMEIELVTGHLNTS